MSFFALHNPSQPLVLYNIWDPGSAQLAAAAGAPAVATSSAAVAEARGYGDGQQLPRDELVDAVRQIRRAVEILLTADIEFGYGSEPGVAAKTALLVAEAGASGCNIEDREPGQDALLGPSVQAKRLAAMKSKLTAGGHDFFVNARTDVFLRDPHAPLDEAVERARIYREAGADGLFVPGLTDLSRIRELCSAVKLPVNVMEKQEARLPELSAAGVARVSFGPYPYRGVMEQFAAAAGQIYA